MKIVHRISIFVTQEIREDLSAIGISASYGFTTFEVDESHDSWPLVEAWIVRHQAVDIVQTIFSKKEIDSANWLELVPSWHHGFPQPNEDKSGYLQVTFDLAEYCKCCGIGARQKASFQMKSEPKWGKNSILQLNWVFDVFFVPPEIWKVVFEPFGVPCRPVLDNKGAELKTVVQLAPETEVDVDTEGLAKEACSCCGQTKFSPTTRGPFPSLVSKPMAHMAKTRQNFGSGASAHRRVLISNDIASMLIKHKVRGVVFRPVEER